MLLTTVSGVRLRVAQEVVAVTLGAGRPLAVLAQTLDRAWSVLRELPRADLTRVRDAVLEKYFTP